MNETTELSHRQQSLYWTQMVELKVAALYIKHYRDYLAGWVTGIATVRAVASSSSIAAWALWKNYALVWGSIIAISQVLDAIKDVFPIAKRHKAASEHALVLDSLFIDTQLEWEGVFSGRYSDDQIVSRLHKLRKLQHDAERLTFKEGLPRKNSLFKQSEDEAKTFFKTTYGVS